MLGQILYKIERMKIERDDQTTRCGLEFRAWGKAPAHHKPLLGGGGGGGGMNL